MKVFAGLVVVALAVTSSYADKSKYIQAKTYDDELDEATNDSERDIVSLGNDLNALTGSYDDLFSFLGSTNEEMLSYMDRSESSRLSGMTQRQKDNKRKVDELFLKNLGPPTHKPYTSKDIVPSGVRTGSKQYLGADDVETVPKSKSARNGKESLDGVDDDDEDPIPGKGHTSKGKKFMRGEEDMTQDMQQSEIEDDIKPSKMTAA